MQQKNTFQQLFFISILACILCSFHLLKSINIPIFIKKIPALYFYIFSIWITSIIIFFIITEKKYNK